MKSYALLAFTLFAASAAFAQDADDATDDAAADKAETTETQSPAADSSPDQPRTMSGMSILGNEEAPKSLVIIPWKSSELGDDISLDDSLDDRARPVDREVFLRELDFYEIRAGRE